MVDTTNDKQRVQTDYIQMLSHSPWRKIRQGQKLKGKKRKKEKEGEKVKEKSFKQQ